MSFGFALFGVEDGNVGEVSLKVHDELRSEGDFWDE